MRQFKNVLQIALLALSFLTIVSCSNLGAAELPENRQNFNLNMLLSDEEQLLLNIVRMQYGDRPYFLSINDVTSLGNNSYAIDGAASYQDAANIVSALQLSPKSQYSSGATTVMAPLQGEKYMRHLLMPIPLKSIHYFVRSGWSIARILQVISDEVGPLENATNASRPGSHRLPVYKNFKEFIFLMRKLQVENKLHFSLDEKNNLILSVDKKMRSAHEYQKLLALLHLNSNTNNICFISEYSSANASNQIVLHTRSVLSVLYYLSKSVEVTSEDINSGIVVVQRYPNGQVFNWKNLMADLMTVHSSLTRPIDANVSVFYRNRWFYIDDLDMDSKQTLTLIQYLFALQLQDK